MILRIRYSISELAEQAQVSPRTIRYYTEIGLLPEPEPEGKYTVYTEDHLNRLKLIAQLKNSYLPLKEIRVYLAGRDEQEITFEVNNTYVNREDNTNMFFSGKPIDSELSSAKDYLRSILGPSLEDNKDESTFFSAPAPTAPMKFLNQKTTFDAPGQRALAADRDVERWERHTIADGVELSVRYPIDPIMKAEIETLLDMARKLFRGRGGRTIDK